MKARTQNRSGRAIQQQEENGSSRTDFLLIYKVFSFTVLVMGISKSTKYIFLYFKIWIRRGKERRERRGNMKRKTFDNYDYEEAFPVDLDRDIQKKARKSFEKEHPLQVPDYEEQWKEQQEKLKEWELERLLKEGKVESLYRTTTTKAKNLQSGSELLEAQIYPSFCHKADVPHTKKGRESKPSQKNLNDKNSRRYFIRLANINFGENDLWCTFTWDKEHIPADEAAADRDIANFIRKINYRQKKAGRENIKYLIIPVVDGAEHPHVHIIMTGQGINRDELEGLWTKGERSNTRRIKPDKDFLLSGVATYMMNNRKGKRKWRGSKNLVKPKEPTRSYSKFKKRTVERMAHDYETLKAEMEKAYPGYKFLDAEVKYNGVTAAFYIYARMVRN